MLTKGISIETVSEMLGRNSIRTTQIYAKVVEKKVAEEMSALKSKLIRSERKTKNHHKS